MQLRPPGSFQMPQANVNPNPSPNHQGTAPSLERHAGLKSTPKYNSDLGRINNGHNTGGAAHSPLARGFLNRGFHPMEQVRKPAEHPVIGSGRGVPNPHQDHQKRLANMGHAEKVAAIEHEKGAPKFRPPHSMHPDTVKQHANNKPRLTKPEHFGAKAMVATSKKPAGPGFHGGATHAKPAGGPGFHGGAKHQLSPSNHPAVVGKQGAVGVKSTVNPAGHGIAHTVTSLSHAPKASLAPAQNAHPKLMPEASKKSLALPSFASKTAPHGALKPQPAKPIVKPVAHAAAPVKPAPTPKLTAKPASHSVAKPAAPVKPASHSVAKPAAKPVVHTAKPAKPALKVTAVKKRF